MHGDHDDHDHDHGSEISPMDARVRALETVLTAGLLEVVAAVSAAAR